LSDDKREELLSAVLCKTVIHIHVSSSYIFHVRFRFHFVYLLGFVFFMLVHVSLGHCVLVLLAFMLLGLVSSVLSQEFSWEERLRNDLFCVKWDIKTLNTLISQLKI